MAKQGTRWDANLTLNHPKLPCKPYHAVTSSLNTNLNPSTDNDHTLVDSNRPRLRVYYHPRPGLVCIRCSRCSIMYPIGVLSYLSLFPSKTYGSSFSEKRLINKILPYLARFFWLVPQLVVQSIIIIRFLFINFLLNFRRLYLSTI
jgi:hypothetical protein